MWLLNPNEPERKDGYCTKNKTPVALNKAQSQPENDALYV